MTAAALQEEARTTAADYRQNAQRSALLAVLARVQSPALAITAPTPDVEGFHRVGTLLSARATMLGALATLYGTLEEGMSYDAGEETRTAFAGLLTSVDGYRAAVKSNGTALADRPQAQGVGQLLGLFAEHIQKKKMRDASELVRDELARVREALAAEMQAGVSIRASNTLLKSQVADALRRNGIADARPQLDKMTALAGTTTAADGVKAYAANARLREALSEYERWANETYEPALTKAAYQASLDVLDELQAQHRKFEAGEPMTLGELVAKAEELRVIADLMKGKSA